MPNVRAGQDKWKARTQAATRDYAQGVARPRVSWAQAAAAAQDNWTAGVTEAASMNSFSRGVQDAGDSRWQAGVQNKGVSRFSPGVAASGDRYQAGFAPYRQAIESIQLPDRGPRGDPSNLQRVAAVTTTLHDIRTRLKSGR
jgi:hypothetical protein